MHHEVVTEGGDNSQLAPMALATQAAIGSKNFTLLADAGYSNGEQLAKCEDHGISKKEKLWLYTTESCNGCSLKSQCTGGKKR